MKGKHVSVAVAAAGILMSAGAPVTAQTRPAPPPAPAPVSPTPLPSAEREFLLQVARGNDHELRLAEMARDKSQRNEVRELATRISQDHFQMSRELRRFAASKGVDLAQTPSGHPDPQLEWLSKVSPAQFDQEFVKALVKDHENDVAQFRRMSTQAQDQEVRAWTAKMLPTLEDHLRAAKRIETNLVGSAR